MQPSPRVSVLMPTYGHAGFIPRAIESLLAQTLASWELIIVDDASPDPTHDAVREYLVDSRIRYRRLRENSGLGAALNVAMDDASAGIIAYLPSDDAYFRDHLSSLVALLDEHPEAVAAYSGVRHEVRTPGHGERDMSSPERVDGFPLQLVQVAHRRTDDRWLERHELVTDDLDRMYWSSLRARGAFTGSGRITCEWLDHPAQLHKVIREPVGGVNPYRARFGVKRPLRFHSTAGNAVDEVALYRRFRERPDTPRSRDGLKILLVGELAYNPERVLALEERGHKLYGLWTRDVQWLNTIGPLPFGHVEDLDLDDWRSELRRVRPDVIYALLNWIAVPFAHEVLLAARALGIPFVWHFKEGPFDCLANGTWPQLVHLFAKSDGQIFCNPETRDWFGAIAPGAVSPERSLLLDGDLPKREWFDAAPARRLSETDGEVHTVVAGRPVGIAPAIVGALGRRGVHVHLHGDFQQQFWREWVREAQGAAPGHLHLHPHVDQERWVDVFSQYDAGWLHMFNSTNAGDVRAAMWADLNYPARIPTLVAAGLPVIQADNSGSVVATHALARRLDIGLYYRDAGQMADELRDQRRMTQLRANVWRHRNRFTFDAHADGLVRFFREAIARRRGAPDTAPREAPAAVDGALVPSRRPIA